MLDRAKILRKSQTAAKVRLWYFLRDRRFHKFKFRKQRIVGGYIIDFICLKKFLIIELDGSQHLENQEYDDI